MNTNWNDPNFQGFGGRQSPFGKRPPRPKKEHKAIGTPLSRTLINLAVTLVKSVSSSVMKTSCTMSSASWAEPTMRSA